MAGKNEKRSLRLLSVLILLSMLFTMLPAQASAASQQAETPKETYDKVMETAVPESFKDENYEPYHFGKDVPFMMNRQSELLFYTMNEDICQEGGDITTFYDKIKAGSTVDVWDSGTKTSALKNPPIALRKAAFVQAVSFDPRKTGRNDHIAFIGVNSTKKAYVWVYDTRNKKWSDGFKVENCAWMQSADITDYEAANFISITAGDYDGDAKDTIVCYAAGDYNSDSHKGDELVELKVTSPAVGSSGSISISENYRSSRFVLSEKFVDDQDSKKIHKIGCALDSGDIDGDGIDDLAAISYYGDADNSNMKAWLYRPLLCVMYGASGNFMNKIGTKVGLWEAYKDESDSNVKDKNWYSCVSPGVACGDIDNDGFDEVIAGGIRNTIKANGAANAADASNADKYNHEIFILNDGKVTEKKVGANKWMTNGFYVDDKVWNKTMIKCVAINGLGNAEMVFINGTLYDIDSKNNITAVETPGYFDNAGDNLGFKASTVMYINSAAAGNFDGNDKGYEQIVFTVSCKTESKQNYDYIPGMIGGKDHNSATGMAGGYYSTKSGSMDDDNAYPHRIGQSNRAGDISEDSGLNCVAVDVDNDNDGMLVRYKGKQLTTADPDILCILQAPPFFKELKDYVEGNACTTYTITNSYSFEKTESSSSSFGVGGSLKIGTPAAEIEVSAGYAREFSKAFTDAFEIEEEFSWTATTEDQVVLYRTPVVCYQYQVQNQSGEWEKDGEENSLVISVPEDPTYTPMSVGTYNKFADYYNKEMAKKNTSFRKMQTLNNLYLGIEGSPDKYITATNKLFNSANNGYELIQRSFQNVGHTAGNTGWSLSKGTSSSVTESLAHGYTFDASVMVGPDLGPASVQGGVKFSLQNMSEESITESTATSNGISCTVDNINNSEIPAKLKPDNFTFSYKMATWPSGLKKYVAGRQTENIPVYGYALSGVYNPLKDGTLSPEEIETLDLRAILETLKDSSKITLEDQEDIELARELYDGLSEDAKKIVDVNILLRAEEKLTAWVKYITSSFQHADISTWEIVFDKDTFVYNGEVQKPVIESIWGFPLKAEIDYEASGDDPESKDVGSYTVTVTGKGKFTGSTSKTYKIVKADNTMTAKGKTAKVKFSKLKKKSQTIKSAKAVTVKNEIGKKSYKLKSVSKSKFKKYFKVGKTGNITVKKGLKKGTYTVKITVKAAGDKNYNSITKTASVKVKVK